MLGLGVDELCGINLLVISPTSRSKCGIDIIITLLTIYVAVTAPVKTAFQHDVRRAWAKATTST